MRWPVAGLSALPPASSEARPDDGEAGEPPVRIAAMSRSDHLAERLEALLVLVLGGHRRQDDGGGARCAWLGRSTGDGS